MKRQPPYEDGAPDVLHDLIDEAWRDGGLRFGMETMTLSHSIGMPDAFHASFEVIVEGHREDRQIAVAFHWMPKDEPHSWRKMMRPHAPPWTKMEGSTA